eukprot:m.63411 g.63411  ORF g.63411 m.63411 type:complete len:234 (+) comp9660_c0_seq2:576-1277(+)
MAAARQWAGVIGRAGGMRWPTLCSPISASLKGVRTTGSRINNARRHVQFAAGPSVSGVPRYAGPTEAEMDPEQRAILADIAKTRTTGIKGPFGPWLANPSIAAPSQELGRVVRYETSFPLRVSELAILVTAAATRCGTEWTIHRGEAEGAGLETEYIEAILNGTATEATFSDPVDRAVWRFADELGRGFRVSDEAYAALVENSGEKGAVELVALVGYYTYVAMTLNTFRIPPT